MLTRSPTAIASAPPEPPSPVTVTITGTCSRAISRTFRAISSPSPRSSASMPRYAPRVSPNRRHWPPMKFSQSRDNRFIVGIPPVAVQFDKIGEQQSNKIQCIRALLVTRDLRALPRAKVGVKLAAQFPNLFTNAFELGAGASVSGEVAQFLDIFFEALDFLLAFCFFRVVQTWCTGFRFVF